MSAPLRHDDHDLSVVRRPGRRLDGDERPVGRTAHFTVARSGHRLVLVHDLDPAGIDNDITGLLVEELFAPGWAAGSDTFERLFVGVVQTSASTPLDGWELFYRNTLRRLTTLTATPPGSEARRPGGTLADFAPIYTCAESRLREVGARSIADLGSCFAFFALRVAAGQAPVVEQAWACDISASTSTLVQDMASRLGAGGQLSVLTCDAACVPMTAGSVDAVTALHLLEHVDAAHGRRILDEAVRLARRRVVVAVPLEDVPDPTFGHVRSIGLDDLAAEGRRLAPRGWLARVEEFHGGWLVLDRVR